ncbi:J domain-containing protein [Candidatus Dependentiae bacterium]|nr:J domain-containing protein [Candidatus Dependentiae bacterium]
MNTLHLFLGAALLNIFNNAFAQKLELINNYGKDVRVIIYHNNGDSPQDFDLPTYQSAPLPIGVGTLATIDHIDISTYTKARYGNLANISKYTIQTLDLAETKKLAQQNPGRTITLSISGSGWLGGSWTTTPSLSTSASKGTATETTKKPSTPMSPLATTLTQTFPLAVDQAQSGNPVYAAAIFGLKPGQTIEKNELRKIYYDLIRKYHPDKNPLGSDLSKVITTAYSAIIEKGLNLDALYPSNDFNQFISNTNPSARKS